MYEADFNTVPLPDIVGGLVENGCVLIRNFVAADHLQRLKTVLDGIYAELKDVHVFGHHLAERGLPDIHEYVFGEQHRALLAQIFSGWRCELYNSSARRMEPPGLEPDTVAWQKPLPPHLDAFLHALPFTINFWLPLQPCGHDAPRLGVVRVPFGDVLDFVGYHDDGPLYLPDPQLNFARFNDLSRQLYNREPAALQAFRSHYADRIWTPHYRLGDAMLLTNWTFHFTHAETGMTARRENIELRFQARQGEKFISLAQFLERRAGSSAASAFTFDEEERSVATPVPNGAAAELAIQEPPIPPAAVQIANREARPAPVPEPAVADGERELSSGMLARDTSFRLLVRGRIGATEIERLIRKLELDRDILAADDGR